MILLKTIIFPFKLVFILVYAIYWKIFGINNFYLISKNTATFYNTIKSSKIENLTPELMSEQELLFLSLVWDAVTYINLWQISVEELYDLSKKHYSLESIMPEFVKLLLIVDEWWNNVNSAFIWPYYSKIDTYIKKWINNSKRFDERCEIIIETIFYDEEVIHYLCELKLKNF